MNSVSDQDDRGRSPSAGRPVRWKIFLFALLSMWAALPLLLAPASGQDAAAFSTAGDLVVAEPDALYPTGDEQAHETRYGKRYCERAGSEACERALAGYFSPPAFLPIVAPLGFLSDTAATFLQRVIGVAALIGSLLLLRRQLAEDTRVDQVLFLTALAATPLAIHTISLGQNTPLLMLSASLGLTLTTRVGRASQGLLWGFAVAAKLFPAALALLLIRRRRWGILGAGTAGLLIASAAGTLLAGPDIWSRFAETLLETREAAASNRYVLSMDNALHSILPDMEDIGWLTLPTRVLAMLAIWFVFARRCPTNLQWAWAWLAVTVISDNVWPHYFLLALPAILLATGRAQTTAKWAGPAFALFTVPMVLTWGTTSPWAGLFTLGLLVVTVVIPWYATRDTRSVPTGR